MLKRDRPRQPPSIKYQMHRAFLDNHAEIKTEQAEKLSKSKVVKTEMKISREIIL